MPPLAIMFSFPLQDWQRALLFLMPQISTQNMTAQHSLPLPVCLLLLQDWQIFPLQFLLPKTSATTVTKLYIENQNRDNVYVTAVVPVEEVQQQGFRVARSDAWGGECLSAVCECYRYATSCV